jgi:tetratricopeptide (TPR) repeat protein
MANPDHPANGDNPPSKPFVDEDMMKEFQELIKTCTEAQRQGHTEEAEQAAMEAMMLAATRTEVNSGPDAQLYEEATKCEEAGDWEGAEAARRQVLALQEAVGNPSIIAEAHRRLCRLLQFLGKLDEAMESAKKATAAARESDLEALLAMALDNEANCALLKEDVDRALNLIKEALQIIGEDPLAQTLRSTLHVTRARGLVAQHDLTGAEQDLATCRKLLGEKPMFSWAGGISKLLADCWEIDAAVCVAKDDWASAVECGRKAVALRREVAQLPLLQGPGTSLALARSLEICAKNLRKTGHTATAKEQEMEASQIRQGLKLPEPP